MSVTLLRTCKHACEIATPSGFMSTPTFHGSLLLFELAGLALRKLSVFLGSPKEARRTGGGGKQWNKTALEDPGGVVCERARRRCPMA